MKKQPTRNFIAKAVTRIVPKIIPNKKKEQQNARLKFKKFSEF